MDDRANLENDLPPEQQHFSELCGPPPLVAGEDPARYQRLLVGVAKALKPADVPEWLWVRDIVDLEWEILRYRSAKARLITSAQAEARASLSLNFVLGESQSDASPPEVIVAHAMAGRLHDLRRFDLMLMSMEYRRDTAYHEIESRRANRGKRSRVAARKAAALAPALVEDHSDN